MNKQELITKLADRTGLTNKKAGEVLEALAELATQELNHGHEVTLPGLGKLAVKHREERTGRNPATGETMHIAAKDVPVFTAAKALKDALA